MGIPLWIEFLIFLTGGLIGVIASGFIAAEQIRLYFLRQGYSLEAARAKSREILTFRP